MVVNLTSARLKFAAALALFVAWVAALVTMAVLSSARPREVARRPVVGPGASAVPPAQALEH
jgi:hypothetical protein